MAGGGQAGPLITFHAPGGRTFQRIFRDVSLSETKQAVRLKLKLPVGEDIRLTRIESGAHIDLDDDDDFDAFRMTTRSNTAVDIAVTVGHSSLAAGPSIPAGVAAAGLPQWDSASALALSRKRKRDRLSIVPGNGLISSAITTTSHAKPAAAGASTSHAAIDHVSPALSAQRTDFDAAPPRKRRKKLKFRDMPTVDRSASNPPASYVPPTPDSLASGPSLPLVHDNESIADTPAQASRPIVPDLAPPVRLGGLARPETTPRRVPPAMSPADRDALLKKLKGGQGNAGSSALAMSSPSKAASDALDTGSEVKKVKSKKGKGVEREIADTREEAPMPAETSRKPKKEKHARAVEEVDDQPSMVLPPKAAVEDEPPVHVPAKEKKSKTKRKDIEADEHAEAPAVTNSAPEAPKADDTSAAPVKTEKKTKKKRKTETEPEHTDVHIAPQPSVDASETSEKRKSKKRRKEGEVAGEPDVQVTPKAALEPTVAVDAPATSSTVDKKGKKRKKEADAESVKPAHAASTSHTTAAASNGFDQEKAVADAVAAIRARHSKSVKLAESEGLSGTPQSVREEPTPAPVAGPSTMTVDPPAKEKRKSKKASTTNASSESVTPPADPVPPSKPKGKKRKGDGSTAESGPAPPSALSEAHISEMWNAVKAAAFVTLNRGPPALPTPPAAAEQPASVPLLEPEALPEVVPDVPAKVKKPKKEKAAKSKAAVPEVIEAADVELVEDAPPDSPATTSATAVETPQSKRKGKSKVREDSRATEAEVDAAKDINMLEEQPKKPSREADAASHASPRASPRPTSPLPQDVQMSSPPRPPAGSNVDEIVVEGHGEGSSGESSSSSDTEDEDEDKDEDNAAVPDLSLVDVEALLRGPASRKSILEVLPSDSEEEDEDSGEEEQSEPGYDEEKEIELDKKFRRLSKRFQRESSSSDEEPEPEPELEPQPEQELDATQEEEEQEVVAATFMDVDPQETLEEEVDPKVPLAIVSASRASIPDDGDVPMAAPGDEEPLGTTRQSSQLPDEVHDPARPISPTMSMMGEDHRRDGSQDDSAQSLAQIEEQLTQVSLRSGTPKIDKTSSSVTPPATSSEPKSTGSGTKRKPSPITRPPGGELEDDPIEPADDLIVPESPSTDMIDPIEPDPEPNTFPAGPERRQSTPPPLPISRPGTVRRMKNRDGKLGTPRPVKASELPIPALNIPSFAELDFEELLAPSPPQTQTKARVTRRTSSAASTAPPPAPTPAPAPRPTPTPTPTLAPAPTPALATEPPAPKRRGRPRLSPEEKERRAAERQAKKDAEKAEKLRLRLERAAAMAAKRVAGRGGRGAKAKAALEVESEDDGEGARAEREGKAPVMATPRPGWTTLTQTQTPRTQEGSLVEESMMVDELRSSSPEHPSPRAEEPEHAPRTPAARAMPPPSIKKGELPSAAGSQPETPAQHPGADPLFLPSSSQVPYTPYALAQPQPRRGGAGESSGESSSERDDEPIAQTQLQHARPWLRDAPFPRLSVLASQAFFTPSSAFALTPVATKDATRGSGKTNEQHEDSDDEDEEDDDSDDDDEEGKKSHIPQERRAGASVQKKRVSGLASFAK